MSDTQVQSETATGTTTPTTFDSKLELIVIPVSDVDRAKLFYTSLGWRLDAEFERDADFRLIQMTPPGSDASVIFGRDVTTAEPGSAQGLHLVVSDIDKAHAALVEAGVDVSEVFHDADGIFHHAGTANRVSGPDPDRRSYCSFLSFSDPDGNGWLMQEITVRLPGRVTRDTTYASAAELSSALRRAAAAHGEHEARTGEADENWPDWYAEYLVREQAGEPLPS